MKNKVIFSIILVSFLIINNQVLASSTNGTIDSTYHYAYGENIGWVDFANVTVTDSALGGSAYSENVGWIDLSTILNDGEGTLSGYAWGENIGWVDFSNVTIDNQGYFLGAAYSENVGWITFAKDTANMVLTDWRPASSRETINHTSSGSSAAYRANFLAQQIVPPTTTSPTPPSTAPLLSRTLKLGMSGTDVQDLQIYLNTHNYILTTTGFGSPNNETKFFGRLTKNAVMKFQKANNLKIDGIVGPITRSLMK